MRPRDSPPRMTAMRSLSNLADHVLRKELLAACGRDRLATADLLAHMAEFDARRLYLAAGYPSMHMYCVHELRMSEDSAFKRWQAARAAREHPAIFDAITSGRLHLSAVVMLAPHLTSESAADLLEAAEHKTKAEISLLLAERFPRADVPQSVRVLAPAPSTEAKQDFALVENALSPAPGQAGAPQLPPRPFVAPLSPGRFELRVTFDQETHSLLCAAQALLGHAIPSGDIAQVLKRALGKLVEAEEKRVFALTARARPRRGTPNGRYVPSEVRREVLLRDGRRCTFKSDSGTRCPACSRLEFDHVVPVARGGESTAANLRLRCRAHNQYEADRAFGAEFMAHKRETAGGRRSRAPRAKAATPTAADDEASSLREQGVCGPDARLSPAPGQVKADSQEADVSACLRTLGYRSHEVRQGVAMSEGAPGATLEDRVKLAIRALGRARYLRSTHTPCPAA